MLVLFPIYVEELKVHYTYVTEIFNINLLRIFNFFNYIIRMLLSLKINNN